MRAMLIAVLVGVAAACGSAAPPALSGLFRCDPIDVLEGQDGASTRRVSFTFHRVTTLAELTSLAGCPELSRQDTLPAELAGAYGSWQEALAAASTSRGLAVASGSVTVTEALSFPGGYACQVASTRGITISADRLLLDDGTAASYHWTRPGQEFDVVLDLPVVEAPETDLLSQSADYDWIYGEWALQADPDNRIVIEKVPKRITEEHLRQVGRAGRADLPVPTVCRYRIEADDYRLEQGGADPEIHYDAGTIAVVQDDRNGPGCATYVAEQRARIGARDAHVAWPVRLSAGALVVEGNLVYVRR